jgi:hypothetical protein
MGWGLAPHKYPLPPFQIEQVTEVTYREEKGLVVGHATLPLAAYCMK